MTETKTLSEDAARALISVGTNRQGAKVRLTWLQVAVERELRDAGLIGPSNGLTRKGSIAREQAVDAAMEAMMQATYSTITSKLGVHVATHSHRTLPDAEKAAREAIESGVADSAAVWNCGYAIRYFGTGR